MKRIILAFLGILGVLLITSSGTDQNARWGVLLIPLFYIGKPWYDVWVKKERKRRAKQKDNNLEEC